MINKNHYNSIDCSDLALESYNYFLPEELIAAYPGERGCSRLLVSRQGQVEHTNFDRLLDFLPANSTLVANNSKVVPARITGQRASGGNFEFLLLTPLPLLEPGGLASCLLKPGKAFKRGQIFSPCPGLHLEIIAKGEFGQHQIKLDWQGDLETIFQTYGTLPLPPYLKRPANSSDLQRYQTVYAKNSGSVAAPTAGLHFTESLKQALQTVGHTWLELTLHVGYGTFSPVRTPDIRQHQLHAEFVEISSSVATAINNAPGPVIAVGTTSVRALEGIASQHNQIIPCADWLNCFIYPGYQFKIINGLITNFHLPQSSLLMLVAAFAGRDHILKLYHQAIQHQYHFFSYGDAMLLI